MNQAARLSPRETQIAELLAWGAAKKEVANKLFISTRTVENTARNIYEKVGVGKANELSAWWFCTNFNISFELSPLKTKIASLCMLFILSTQIYANSDDVVRHTRTRTSSVRGACRSRRKNETDFN